VLIRMITPMRREFACTLDVQHFLRDPAYADAILKQAETSANDLLRSYVQRIRALRDAPEDGVTAPLHNAGPSPGMDGNEGKDGLTNSSDSNPVDAMLNKYTQGLR
jgi:hypothetical protein